MQEIDIHEPKRNLRSAGFTEVTSLWQSEVKAAPAHVCGIGPVRCASPTS